MTRPGNLVECVGDLRLGRDRPGGVDVARTVRVVQQANGHSLQHRFQHDRRRRRDDRVDSIKHRLQIVSCDVPQLIGHANRLVQVARQSPNRFYQPTVNHWIGNQELFQFQQRLSCQLNLLWREAWPFGSRNQQAKRLVIVVTFDPRCLVTSRISEPGISEFSKPRNPSDLGFSLIAP